MKTENHWQMAYAKLKKKYDNLQEENEELETLIAFKWEEVRKLQAENEHLKTLNQKFRERLIEIGDIDIVSQIEIYNKPQTKESDE